MRLKMYDKNYTKNFKPRKNTSQTYRQKIYVQKCITKNVNVCQKKCTSKTMYVKKNVRQKMYVKNMYTKKCTSKKKYTSKKCTSKMVIIILRRFPTGTVNQEGTLPVV